MYYSIHSKTLRVREPVTRSRGKVRGQFPSNKMSKMIAWESQLERRACYLFEFSSGIVSFREQPIKFLIPFLNQLKRYTPDFELILESGEICYAEIKPKSKLENPENKSFFDAVSKELKSLGYLYIILTEEELIHPVRERNLTLLRHYLSQPLSQNQIEIASNWIANAMKPCRFGTLIQVTGSLTIAYSLIAQGYLWIDVKQPVSSQTYIFAKEHCCENHLFTYRTSADF